MIKAAPLTHRLSLLREIMLRDDLTDAERRLCWFLICERMNEDTALCVSSDHTIADRLKVNKRTIEKAKRRLRDLRILSWTPGLHAGSSSSYRFSLRLDRSTDRETDSEHGRPSSRPVPVNTPPVQPPVPVSTPVVTTNPPKMQHGPMPDGRFFVQYDTPEWDYWDAFLRKTTGTGAFRGNRATGRPFDTRWPKESVQ